MKTLIRAAVLAASCVAQGASAAPAPKLHSTHAVVFDATNQEVLLDKDGETAAPIASITKVMTAMVALDAKPDMRETLQVSGQDVDNVKHSSSRVAVGTEFSREDAMHIALMSSENRAASALSRNYPGGNPAFVQAMNVKARKLGMTSTNLEDPTGLSPHNQASAQDLVRMVLAAEHYQPITQFTTSSEHTLPIGHRTLSYHNSNPLVGKPNWNIELSKTGYTKEAGRCIVMKLAAAGKQLVVVLLGSQSSGARLADIQSIKRWVSGDGAVVAVHSHRLARTDEVRHAALKPSRTSLLRAKRSAAKESPEPHVKRRAHPNASKAALVAPLRGKAHAASASAMKAAVKPKAARLHKRRPA
jgi:D-alanyl-D-alanine endopeptidase (penicillin-binding protein 7)